MNNWSSNAEPYQHWVMDGVFAESLITAALVEWPSMDWPHWHVYADPFSVKRATKDVDRLPPACRHLFDRLCAMDVGSITGLRGLFPDWTGYGAGLHSMAPGGHLGWHLDSERHPSTGWMRRLSCCLYLSDWQPGDGGELMLGHSPMEAVRSVEPKRNRVVLFECGPASYHAVHQVAGDGGRHSIAAFYWQQTDASLDPHSDRLRASFVTPD